MGGWVGGMDGGGQPVSVSCQRRERKVWVYEELAWGRRERGGVPSLAEIGVKIAVACEAVAVVTSALKAVWEGE